MSRRMLLGLAVVACVGRSGLAGAEFWDFSQNPFSGASGWCEHYFNVRWENGEMSGFTANCCLSGNTSGGNTFYGEPCAAPSGTGGPCCTPGPMCEAPPDPVEPKCISRLSGCAWQLVTKADRVGPARSASMSFRLGSHLEDDNPSCATDPHFFVTPVAHPTCHQLIEPVIARVNGSDPPLYQLSIIIADDTAGTCGNPTGCAGGCNGSNDCCVSGPIFSLNPSLTYTLSVETQKFLTSLFVDASISGNGLNQSVSFEYDSTTNPRASDFQWYNATARRFSVGGTRSNGLRVYFDNVNATAGAN